MFPFGDALELTVLLTCVLCLDSCFGEQRAPGGQGTVRSPRWACFAASFAWSPWPLLFLRQVGWLQALPGLAVWTLLQSRRRPGVGAAPSLAREGRCGSANTRVTTSRWDCREMPESRSFAHVVLGVLLESLELQKKRKMGREVRQASLSHNLR